MRVNVRANVHVKCLHDISRFNFLTGVVIDDTDVLLGNGDSTETDLLVEGVSMTEVDWWDRVGVVMTLPAVAMTNSCEIVGVVTVRVYILSGMVDGRGCNEGCGSNVMGDMVIL